jgi:protein-tyrosine kinase
MSRVHDALRKAATEKTGEAKPPVERPTRAAVSEALLSEPQEGTRSVERSTPPPSEPAAPPVFKDRSSVSTDRRVSADLEKIEEAILQVPVIPFSPAPEALLVDPAKPKDAPSEEFRSLRTRLNHLQKDQALHTLVVTSASPGEGKSFTACNLAICHAQLSGKRILLADFDFRRPSVDKIFGLTGVPGITDFLLGRVGISEIMHRVEGTNLYVITAGESVPNPLELLNLRECSTLIETFRDHFDWVILDSPPLLFAADGNLLATMADGTILVVRIGATTFDSVTRALQSLCENNVLGVVVNGAHRGELYSKYAYYQNYYYEPENRIETSSANDKRAEAQPVGAGKD